jgi:hypothetical protein
MRLKHPLGREAATHDGPAPISRRMTLLQTAVIASVVLVFAAAVIAWNAYRLSAQLDERIDNLLAVAETSLSTAV